MTEAEQKLAKLREELDGYLDSVNSSVLPKELDQILVILRANNMVFLADDQAELNKARQDGRDDVLGKMKYSPKAGGTYWLSEADYQKLKGE